MKGREIVERLCRYTVLGLFGAILAALFVLSLFGTSYVGNRQLPSGVLSIEYTSFRRDNPLWGVATLAVFLLGLRLFAKVKEKHGGEKVCTAGRCLPAYGVLAIVLAVLGSLFVLMTQLDPLYDQRKVLEVAGQMRKYNFSEFVPGKYMDIYPSQQGIVLFYYIFSGIFGNYNYVAAQLLNVFALVFAFYFLAKTAEEFLSDCGAAGGRSMGTAVNVACLCFLPAFFYLTFVYGTIVGFSLSLAAVYLQQRYFKTRNLWQALASAVLIELAVVLKLNELIFLAGMLVLLVYDLLTERFRVKTLIYAGMILAVYFAGSKGVNWYMARLSGIPLEQGVPAAAYVAMGMQEGDCGPGWYNEYNVKVYIDSGLDTEKAGKAAIARAKESLLGFADDLPYAASFFGRKVASEWNDPTFQSFWIMDKREPGIELPPFMESLIYGKIRNILTAVMNQFQTLILAGALLWLVWGTRRIPVSELIFPIIFIGGFLFHLVWEAKSQYTLPYFMLLIPLAVKGYWMCVGRLEK